MNLRFLGDPLDHWKGSLFKSLNDAQILRDFAVDPIARDEPLWRPPDFELYASLLRIKPSQIIRHRVSLQERARYFDEISHGGDLFLDPDTGVRTGRVKTPGAYVNPAEIDDLLDTSSNRLLVVYQHVRGNVARRIDEVVNSLEHEIGFFDWCSYECPTVAMLFVARLPSRTKSVARFFNGVLGRHAGKRIRMSKPKT